MKVQQPSDPARRTVYRYQNGNIERRYIASTTPGGPMERADAAVLTYFAGLLILVLAGIFLVPA